MDDDDLLELDQDLPCRNCGYNLRGVLANGDCPECAHSVQDSIERWMETGTLRSMNDIMFEGCAFMLIVVVVFLMVIRFAVFLGGS